MSGLFEVLAGEDASTQERLAGTRAVIAVQSRAKDAFETFVSKAQDQDERDARIAIIGSDLDKIVQEVGAEYGTEDLALLRNAATVALGGGHPSGCDCGFCKNKGTLPGSKKDDDANDKSDDKSDDGDGDDDDKDGKKDKKKLPWESSTKTACSDCTEDEECDACKAKKSSSVDVRQMTASAAPYDWERVAAVHTADGFSFCKCNCDGCNTGNHCESEECISTKHSGNPGNPESAKSSEKTAADTETGDTFVTERVDLPSNKTDGWDGPSPKIDKGPSGDNLGWDLPEIEVPSKQHPVDRQQIHETPEYTADLPGVTETGKSVDADAPLQPEFNVGDNTDTWTGTTEQGGQANPVTSAVLAKWQVVS